MRGCGHEVEEDGFEGVLAGVLAEFGHGAEGDEFAAVDDADAVGEFFGDVEEVGGHEDGDTGAGAGFEFFLDDAHVDWVEADHGFVDDDDLGVVEESGGDGEPDHGGGIRGGEGDDGF